MTKTHLRLAEERVDKAVKAVVAKKAEKRASSNRSSSTRPFSFSSPSTASVGPIILLILAINGSLLLAV